MPELAHLNRPKPVTANIDLGGGDLIGITFDSNRMNRGWDERTRTERGFAQGLSEVILSWDVEENGQPLPPSTENIERMSIPAQAALFQQIINAAIPSSAEGEVSSALSSRTPQAVQSASTPPSPAIQPTPQNGQVPSESLVPSASPSPT